MILRDAVPQDVPALRTVYADAVHALAPPLYNAEQVRVWASFAEQDAFVAFIREVDTLVAEVDGRPVGFCGLGADGHVASVYVVGRAAGQGVGTRLLSQALRDHPAPTSGRYFAEASLLSRPLFLKLGFVQIGIEHADRDGIAFERFLMQRPLDRPVRSDCAKILRP